MIKNQELKFHSTLQEIYLKLRTPETELGKVYERSESIFPILPIFLPSSLLGTMTDRRAYRNKLIKFMPLKINETI